jgi:phosphoribosyl 1,2-cyclic phosphodiesterase
MRSFELTFLGTRGGIEAHSRRHRYHSALLIQGNDARIMIDCGADWLDRVRRIAPTAIVLTHAHPDHAGGLIRGAPCPVYATEETLNLIRRYPIRDRRQIPLRRSITIERVKFKAFPVEHSIRAPAVGYRVSTAARDFFYVSDVANLPDPADALRGVALYIGDGATIKRSMVRKQKGTMVGHAPVTTQLGWCAKAHVRRAIFTHCGSPVVRGDARVLNALVHQIGHEHGVDARLASDGDRLTLDDSLHQTRIFKNWPVT